MRTLRSSVAGLVIAVSAVSLLAGCASPAGAGSPGPSSSPAALHGTIVVDAAASLTGTFTEIATQFEAAHPGTTVTLNFGGSSALATAIVAGAPVDVFAAASPATMTTVTDAHLASDPAVFVSNTLEIAVPRGNPGRVTGLADFAKPQLTIALCAPEVPCGAAAAAIFAKTGIADKPDTLEPDVKSALAKVALGEVDAALVYHTDVLAAGAAVEGIPFPEAAQAVNDYPIARIDTSKNAALASAFIAYVRGAHGAAVLNRAGFTTK
ncbi:molybdate ABC transporter substrate-binding protein [Galbitalea soli]|uniref:Molybdate ABC transporter substrate-binding protein n=1 Tax=Galbitalea soli TaxID=1268042 RepID=A0A7C9TQN3_9MICO|nr:molybdate ABC transporter substrate-binding protein [Galbitalea soli]NEM90764.1 molybdate ABC transporter substrate-binding protein [Galbitalea soli]